MERKNVGIDFLRAVIISTNQQATIELLSYGSVIITHKLVQIYIFLLIYYYCQWSIAQLIISFGSIAIISILPFFFFSLIACNYPILFLFLSEFRSSIQSRVSTLHSSVVLDNKRGKKKTKESTITPPLFNSNKSCSKLRVG